MASSSNSSPLPTHSATSHRAANTASSLPPAATAHPHTSPPAPFGAAPSSSLSLSPPRADSPPLAPTPSKPRPGFGQRQSFIPSTPNFTVPSPDQTFSTLPEPSPISSLPGAADAPRSSAAVLGVSTSSAHSIHPSQDYFPSAVAEKYPPHANGHAQSSAHLPLLGGSDDDMDGYPYARTGTGRGGAGVGGGSGGNGPLGALVAALNSRARLHPLTLLPAFFIGIIVAMSGVLGPTLRNGAATTKLMASLSSTFKASAPGDHNYTLHSSGHVFVRPSALWPGSSDSSPYSSSEAKTLRPHTMRHPIHDLIANATDAWEKKLARQSKTLEEAVREYKRRFGRKPPKGFDDWFRFAQDNDVILLDEFDQTFTDILPFYAMPPATISQRADRLQVDPSTFTMVIAKGQVEIIGAHAKDGRAKDQLALMKRWARWVPDVNITMSAHDGPSIMMDWRGRQRHLDAAKSGKHLSQEQLDEVDEDAALWGFPLACPPDSRLRRAYDGLELDNLPRGPSFIADHLKTMDMCENPEWQYLHGFTSWPGMRPQTLRPLFSFAKTPMHSDILLTPLEQYWDHEPWDPKWEDKPNDKAVWRGSTTGVWFDRGTWWRSSQRVRLWFMGKDKTGHRRVRFSGEGTETPPGVESLIEKNVSTLALMNRYVDFAFTGKEGQCSEDDGSCEAVRQMFDFQRSFGWNEANEYKYMLDLDGNAWSGRFHRLLSSNSAVLKSTIFPEWYAGWIQPWVHYIPLKIDYTDLFDIMAFFAGDLDGRNNHDALAKQIADNGKDYATRFWRYADMEAYFFRLALEWARVTSPDRSAMDYHGPGS
ncbi:hypothetical protein JCM8097_006919 [Rhodosporidiobolus ruineniae]